MFLQGVPFLNTTDIEILGEICLKLRLDVYLAKDIIFREGELGRAMYVVKEGCVEVLAEGHQWLKPGDATPKGRRARKRVTLVNSLAAPERRAAEVMVELRRNDYFGELAIVSGGGGGGRRHHSTRAGTVCELLRLSKADFGALSALYPAFRRSSEREVARLAGVYRAERKRHARDVDRLLAGAGAELADVSAAATSRRRSLRARLHATATPEPGGLPRVPDLAARAELEARTHHVRRIRFDPCEDAVAGVELEVVVPGERQVLARDDLADRDIFTVGAVARGGGQGGQQDDEHGKEE